jgi:hypothetical protein
MPGPPAGAPHHTAALVTAGIRKKIATCRGRGLADLRDRALQLLGYARVRRRAELVAIAREHITFTPKGLRL